MYTENKSQDCYTPSSPDAHKKKIITDILGRAETSQSDAVLISPHGKMIASYLYKPDLSLNEAMSVTKSIVSLGIGILYDAHLISLDDPVSRFYPEWRQGDKKLI